MSLADSLLNRFKRSIAVLELVPSEGGCFEVTVEGDLIYSKLDSGRFPEEGEVERLLTERR